MMALPDEMEAILIDKFVPHSSDLRVTRIPTPLTPQNRSTTLLIRTTHVAVSHVDLLYLQGKHQNNQRHAKPPLVLGSDFSGVVVHAPPDSSFTIGEQVFGSTLGAFAEYVVVDTATEGALRRIPRGWDAAGACAVGSSGSVSYGALVTAGGLKGGSGWTVLVLGAAGGLGVVAVQIAKRMGARVIAVCNTDGNQKKADILRKVGADAVIGYQAEGWEEQVREATPDGEGVDLVYDSVGAVLSSIKCCKFGGRVVIVGFAGREGKMEEVRANRILLKNVSVIGFRFGEFSRRYPDKAKATWNSFMQMVDAGEIQPVPYDEQYNGLRAVPRALEDLRQRRAWGRAVVHISSQESDQERPKL